MKYYLLSALVLSSINAGAIEHGVGQLAAEEGVPELSTISKIPDLMAVYGASGLALTAVVEDKIVFSGGFGSTADGKPYSSSTSCGLFSATKVLASLTYANLASDGRINPDAALARYIEDVPEAWAEIPFYRLLNHTSGITMAVNKGWFGALASNPGSGNSDIYHKLKQLPLDYAPGEHSRYRQSGYAVAELILESQLDASFSDLVASYIIEPANMTDTKHPAVSDPRYPALLLSAGGFVTTADDMAKLFVGINTGEVISPNAWKNFILKKGYRFDNYSLGSLIEEQDGILTIGHSGGGARANIRYAPDERTGVMICTDDRDTKRLAISLARMLMHELVKKEEPPLPLLMLFGDYSSKTGADIVSTYKSAKRQGSKYDSSDAEILLNSIGYSFLARNQHKDAIEVFELNVSEHPKSANTYDSLGEALLASGDEQGALIRYKQALAINPDNENAATIIKKLQGEN